MSNSEDGLLPGEMVYALQLLFGQLVGESVLEGILVLTAGMAIYTLVLNGLHDSTRIATILTLLAITVMLLLSLLMWACDVTMGLLILTQIGPKPSPGLRISEMVAVGRICSRLIFLIGDLIVASRAWILGRNPIVRTCLAISVLATIACDLAEVVLAVRTSFTNDEGFEDPIFTLIRGVPLLFTNVLATTIIAYKTWTYRAHIKIYLQEQDRRNRVEKVLILLVESGGLYCVLWIVSIIFDTAFDTFAPQSQIVGSLIPYIAGIYPTAMILLVAGAKADQAFGVTEGAGKSSLRFAPPQAHRHTAHTHSILQSMADHLHHSIVESTTSDVQTEVSIREKCPSKAGGRSSSGNISETTIQR